MKTIREIIADAVGREYAKSVMRELAKSFRPRPKTRLPKQAPKAKTGGAAFTKTERKHFESGDGIITVKSAAVFTGLPTTFIVGNEHSERYLCSDGKRLYVVVFKPLVKKLRELLRAPAPVQTPQGIRTKAKVKDQPKKAMAQPKPVVAPASVAAAPQPLNLFDSLKPYAPISVVAKILGVTQRGLVEWGEKQDCLGGKGDAVSISVAQVRQNTALIKILCATKKRGRPKKAKVPSAPAPAPKSVEQLAQEQVKTTQAAGPAMQEVLFESSESGTAEAQVPGNIFYLPTNDNGSGTPPTELPH